MLVLTFTGCTNPFAPALDESDASSGSSISDLKSVDGIFQNLQYSYTFKDTLVYGEMLSADFIFSYRDYEKGIDVTWGRDEEMRATYGLFQNSSRLDLIWNNVVLSSQDSLTANIVRGFNLTVTLNPTDVIRLDGRVNLFLKKNASGKWQIARWLDESNF